MLTTSASYDARKERERVRQAEESAEGRRCPPYRQPRDKNRRDACERDFQLFCETYFPAAFPLAWSDDHLRVIGKIERAVLDGGLFALAMPRGSGKTTLCERAVIWAAVYGHHGYTMLICADETKAAKCLDKIKLEFEANDLLYDDFHEVCLYIRQLERIANRCKGQLTHEGEPTRIEWTAGHIVLPTAPGSVASGAIIAVGGITSAVRGAAHARPDGRIVRPSLALIDDPQTRESAASPLQRKTRTQIISADILGMAGPGQPFAALMPCTVIYKDDAADEMLDRTKHPDWQGERTKLLYEFPKRMDLWEEYWQIRSDELLNDGDGSRATEFYREHRAEMDEGAVVAWPERHKPNELSALQHAMNLYFRDPEAFASEYQNEPVKDDDALEELTVDQIVKLVNGCKRRMVPLTANWITAFVDVQKKALWYCVVAWEDNFTGYIIDYGAWPDQKLNYFTLSTAKNTMQLKYPGQTLEGQIYNGLKELTGDLLDRRWQRQDGAGIQIDKLLIDANWGESTDTVYKFCADTEHSSRITPSHGKFFGASSQPLAEWKRKRGDRVGHHWIIPALDHKKRQVRHVLIDTNYWKSFVHARLSLSIGEHGSLSLFKAQPHIHRMIAEHLTAEFRVKTQGRGREVDEWKLKPGNPDNHLLDCVVGCAVAAEIQGVTIGHVLTAKKPKLVEPTERLSLAEMRARKRGR